MEDDELKIVKQLKRGKLLSPPTLWDHMLFLLICDKQTQLGQRGGLHWTLLDTTGLQVVSPFSPVAQSITYNSDPVDIRSSGATG